MLAPKFSTQKKKISIRPILYFLGINYSFTLFFLILIRALSTSYNNNLYHRHVGIQARKRLWTFKLFLNNRLRNNEPLKCPPNHPLCL